MTAIQNLTRVKKLRGLSLQAGDIIGLDFDGVIADTETTKLNFARNELGLKVTKSQLKRHNFRYLFGDIEGDELYDKMITSLYKTNAMVETIQPVTGAARGILWLVDMGFECVVVTARQGPIDNPATSLYWAAEFLKKHGVFSLISNILSANNLPKSRIANSRDIKVFVDDDLKELEGMVHLRTSLFLFENEHNRSSIIPVNSGIKRVTNWPDLLSQIYRMMPLRVHSLNPQAHIPY